MSPKTPTLAEVLRTAIANRLADVHVMLPGRVERYLPDEQKADVQPMIRRFEEGAGGETIAETYPVIPAVPVAFPRGGGYKLTFPLEPGDYVTLVFCESSIDAYQASSGREPVSPDLFQRFDLSDAVAIPGWYPDPKKIADPNNEAAVLARDRGAAVRVSRDAVALFESIVGSTVTGASVHVGGDQVNLYEASAADFVALALKVKTEIDKLVTDINTLKTVFSAWIPVPNDGGAALKTASATWYGSPLSASSSTGAAKVKAT